mmetsp:Transcript_43951/g.86185  ORF Transcript_43951/g.86185 Transcript_43951/m.86185 type:complete len:204 (+) Transcript_43951:657-1268(+)
MDALYGVAVGIARPVLFHQQQEDEQGGNALDITSSAAGPRAAARYTGRCAASPTSADRRGSEWACRPVVPRHPSLSVATGHPLPQGGGACRRRRPPPPPGGRPGPGRPWNGGAAGARVQDHAPKKSVPFQQDGPAERVGGPGGAGRGAGPGLHPAAAGGHLAHAADLQIPRAALKHTDRWPACVSGDFFDFATPRCACPEPSP